MQPECEAYHSPPSNAEVKKGGAIFPLPHGVVISYLSTGTILLSVYKNTNTVLEGKAIM
jgi:hypothetical protein